MKSSSKNNKLKFYFLFTLLILAIISCNTFAYTPLDYSLNQNYNPITSIIESTEEHQEIKELVYSTTPKENTKQQNSINQEETKQNKEYYADIVITIDESGSTTIQGLSNHPTLTTILDNSSFTSKDKQYWVFNLTLEEKFSDYAFEIKLPKGTAVNYMKLPSINLIEDENEWLTIKGTGSNQMSFIVQYKLESSKNQSSTASKIYNLILIGIISILIINIIFITYTQIKSKAKNAKKVEERKPSDTIDFENLSERQKDIMKIIINNNGETTQNKIEQELNIPKSSLSRNIDSLCRKSILLKQKNGMTNLLILNENKKKRD